jgi:DNA-binding PadR family transcriptional regulator
MKAAKTVYPYDYRFTRPVKSNGEKYGWYKALKYISKYENGIQYPNLKKAIDKFGINQTTLQPICISMRAAGFITWKLRARGNQKIVKITSKGVKTLGKLICK